MKRVSIIFISAFLLNLAWESLHAVLYANHQGGEITQFILLRASLADALMITLITLPFIFLPFFKKHLWLVVLFGVILSVLIEIWALNIGRWSYNEYMPIIPYLSVGLTPVIQLGLLGYISFKIPDHFLRGS